MDLNAITIEELRAVEDSEDVAVDVRIAAMNERVRRFTEKVPEVDPLVLAGNPEAREAFSRRIGGSTTEHERRCDGCEKPLFDPHSGVTDLDLCVRCMSLFRTRAARWATLDVKLQKWARERNLHLSTPEAQFLKTVEEVGELARAIAKVDRDDYQDATGDIAVTLFVGAMTLGGSSLLDCLETAYKEIADRTGKTVNGVFVKDE